MEDSKRCEDQRLDGAVFRDCSAADAMFDNANLAAASFVNASMLRAELRRKKQE